MQISYANAFRTNETAEEVMLDFGLNVTTPAAVSGSSSGIAFLVTSGSCGPCAARMAVLLKSDNIK